MAEGIFANLFRNGWVGVDLFFVLSGYLIAAGLIRRSGKDGFKVVTSRYFTDRVLRIVPAYYAVLVLCFLAMPHGSEPTGFNSGQSLFAHLLFLQDYTGSNINVVFWSLGVEEKFYIIAPLLVFGLARRRSLSACLVLAACLLLISPVARAVALDVQGTDLDYSEFFRTMRSPFHMSLDGFVIGIMIAVLSSRGLGLSAKHAACGLTFGAAVLLVWLGSHEFLAAITRFDAWLQPSALALLFGWMMWCALFLGGRKPACEPFFRVNARLSYALYLVHFPLIPLAAALAGEGASVAFWAWYLGLSYAAALIVHFGVEKAFMQLKSGRTGHGAGSASFARSEVVPS